MFLNEKPLNENHFSKNFSSELNNLKEVNKLGIAFLVETDQTLKSATLYKIIECFHNYILKYTNLVKYGKIDLRQKDSRNFLSLFISRSKLSNKDEYNSALRKVAGRMPVAFFEWEVDDVYNELVGIFIEIASKYDSKEVGFTYYMQTFFRFAVKQWITKKWNDAQIYSDAKLNMDASDFLYQLESAEISVGSFEDIPKDLLDLEYQEDFGIETVNFHDKWILDCKEEPFKSLTVAERQIIFLRFGLNLNYSEIEKNLCIRRKILKEELDYITEILNQNQIHLQ